MSSQLNVPRPARTAAGPSPDPAGLYTADIDIGGTLTDGLFNDGTSMWTAKVDTTPHDFTVCFFDCLREGARLAGFDDLTAFLKQVAVIRWSATIATNILAERKGPRIGLVVSPGQERLLYGAGESPALGTVVAEEDVVTIGNPDDEAEVLTTVRGLLERGVRRVCVNLAGSYDENAAELRIKRLVDEQFPDHYLGSVPVVLGSEIAKHPDDATRTHLSLINAYVHTPLAAALFRAEDELLSLHRYRRPLYIGHVNGGVARVAKTKGVDTIESGPVFGLAGASLFARLYEHERVLAVDVGGTTAKVGAILDGRPLMVGEADFFGIPASIPWLLLRSVSLGGGTVARVDDGAVTLGPESMGAFPGPAAYDLGGSAATLTDALLSTGRLNPERFLGGTKRLSVDRAIAAIEQDISGPLEASVADAADKVMETAVGMVADTVERTLAEAGLAADGFELYCFGGNGGNFAAPLAERLGLERAHAFALGPVLSALGSSVSDVCHVHEEWPHISVGDLSEEELDGLLDRGREGVFAELEGEGLESRDASLQAELNFETADGSSSWTGAADPAQIHSALKAASADAVIRRFAVTGVFPVPSVELLPAPSEHYEPGATATRATAGGDLPIHDWGGLRPGAAVSGPAMLESDTNTCVVPLGWGATIDGFGNAVLTPGWERTVDDVRIAEYLDLSIEAERWRCHVCAHDLGPAEENFKKGCLVYARDPSDIHRPLIEDPDFTFAPDPEWVQIVEFYCPGCGTQIETEHLPPGHPITHDVEIDVPRLRARIESGELRVEENRLVPND